MKKLFSLAAVVLTALAVNAATQTARITFAVGQTVTNGQVVTEGAISMTITDANTKFAIDANSCYFGDATAQEKFEARMKTGGKSSSNSKITLATTNAGTLKIYARSGSASDTTRTIVLKDGSTEVYKDTLLDAEAIELTPEGETAQQKIHPIRSIALGANKTYTLEYPINGVNFYCIEYIYDGEAPAPKAGLPLFSVAQGTYNEAFDLTISASNADHIYCKVNDGDFAEYSAPIAITSFTEETVVTAFCTKADALNSDTISATYKLAVPRPVFNYRTLINLADIQASDIKLSSAACGSIGSYTMDGAACPSVNYLHIASAGGGDSTLTVTFTSAPDIELLYKNGSAKSNAFKFAKSYAQFDAKNVCMYIDNVQGGDTIVIVATSKGSTAAHFDEVYSTACYLDPYQPEDDTDPCFTDGDIYTESSASTKNNYEGFTNLVYVVQEGHTKVRIKETAGGVRVAKVLVGATRGEVPATAVENVEAASAKKIMLEGQVIIIKNDVRYNTVGMVIE